MNNGVYRTLRSIAWRRSESLWRIALGWGCIALGWGRKACNGERCQAVLDANMTKVQTRLARIGLRRVPLGRVALGWVALRWVAARHCKGNK